MKAAANQSISIPFHSTKLKFVFIHFISLIVKEMKLNDIITVIIVKTSLVFNTVKMIEW
jgi:hypothetical protein